MIATELSEDGVALLTLDRPTRLNALNGELLDAWQDTLATWAAEDAVKVLVVTGRGRAFCAGADLVADGLDDSRADMPGDFVAESMRTRFNPAVAALYQFPKPTVIAVNGMAAGGGAGLALCGDVILAAEEAALKVVQPQQLGIAGDLGINWLLQRIVGRSRALSICLLGESVSAEKMLEWGMVSEVLPQEQLLPRAREVALRLAQVPAAAVVATRKLIDEAPGRSLSDSLEDEREAQRQLCNAPVFMQQVRQFTGGKHRG